MGLSQSDKAALYLKTLDTLKEVAAHYPLLPGLVYTSPFDFVVQHGKVYDGPWDKRYSIGAQKMCFGNAMVMAGWHGLRYAEGIAVAPTGFAILHGWNILENGGLLDTTWGNTGLLYLGVEFSLERADDAIWNGDAHVLNDEHRGHPLFRQPWTGEDYGIKWPSSDRLDAMRRHDRSAAAQIVTEWALQRTQEIDGRTTAGTEAANDVVNDDAML